MTPPPEYLCPTSGGRSSRTARRFDGGTPSRICGTVGVGRPVLEVLDDRDADARPVELLQQALDVCSLGDARARDPWLSWAQPHVADRGKRGDNDSDNRPVLPKPPFPCLCVSADIPDMSPGEPERDRDVNEVTIASASKF